VLYSLLARGFGMNICSICGKSISDSDTYEYRGQISCDDHFDEMCEARDSERAAIIKEESAKTDKLKRLDFGNGPIGAANRKLLAGKLKEAKTESFRLKRYEGRS
jgi:recombinational DNA repair protein (RecF pathway)